MTEQEWLTTTDCDAMLRFLQGGFGERLLARLHLRDEKISRRKLRLFYCACAREDFALASDPELLGCVQLAEQFADDAVPRETLRAASDRIAARSPSFQNFLAWRACDTSPRFAGLLFLATDHLGACISYAADVAPELEPPSTVPDLGGMLFASNRKPSADLLRDIFPGPFQDRAIEASELSANGSAATRLAAAMYETGNFADLPILADALEEAGCRDEVILAHCREPGVHTRGCWVVDALLGRT